MGKLDVDNRTSMFRTLFIEKLFKLEVVYCVKAGILVNV